MSAPDRTAMLERVHPGLSIRRECRLLGLARSNVYRAPPGGATDELVIMRRLDELFLAWPFFGSRRMTAMLRGPTSASGRWRRRSPGSARRRSSTPIRAASSPRSPLPQSDSEPACRSRGTAGGRWLDKVFIERLWRSRKSEEVYLESYADGREARAAIAAWIVFYNGTRPHQALDDRAPMTVWRAGMTGLLPAIAVDMTLQPPAGAWTKPRRRPHGQRGNRSRRSMQLAAQPTERRSATQPGPPMVLTTGSTSANTAIRMARPPGAKLQPAPLAACRT